jgi:hypothetical protein
MDELAAACVAPTAQPVRLLQEDLIFDIPGGLEN